MMLSKNVGWRAWASSVICIGIAGSLLAGLSLFESPQRNVRAQTADGNGSVAASAMKPRADYSLFLPLVFRNYASPVESVFGMQVYLPFGHPGAGISLMQEAHVRWVRTPVSWSDIEATNTEPASYDFSAYDASILAARQAGFVPIATIVGNPSWAATYPQGPIDKVPLSKFTAYIGALATRYNGDPASGAPGAPEIVDWEFYNEPDNSSRVSAERGWAGYWGNYGAEYAQMLCAVYPVIKAANPRARVVIGGVAYDWFTDQGGPFVRNFLDDVLTAGGGQCFDAMNFHYYPAFASNWAAYGPGLIGKAAYLKNKLAQYGLPKPMICTEAGWPSDVHQSTPEIQTQYVAKLFTQSRASNLENTIWWTWIDPGPYYGAFGLVTQSLERKPSFYGYKAAAEKIGGAGYLRALSAVELGDSAMEGYLFILNMKYLYVLWSNDGIARTVALPLPRAQITDLYGTVTGTINAGTDGYIRVDVGADPVYVEEVP